MLWNTSNQYEHVPYMCANDDSFWHGKRTTQDEAQMVADRLAARTDGLVDYEELYRLLLETPPPKVTRECFPLRHAWSVTYSISYKIAISTQKLPIIHLFYLGGLPFWLPGWSCRFLSHSHVHLDVTE